jgi:hypothetical protein
VGPSESRPYGADSLVMDDGLDKLLHEHGGLEGLARELGQDDPTRRRWEPAANKNAQPIKISRWRRFGWRIWNSTCAPILGLWIGFGYPAACFVLLWDEHHPWLLNRYPYIGIAALISFFGPLAIVGFMYWRWEKRPGHTTAKS